MPISLYKIFSVSHYKTSIVLHGFFYARGYFGVLYLPPWRTTKSAYKITVLCKFLHVELLSQPQTWRAHHQVFNFLKSAARGSKVSTVGIVTSTIQGLIPGEVYIFMFSKRLWGSNSLYSKGSGTLSSEGYADHSFLSSAVVKREWSNTSTSPYACTAWTGATLQSVTCPCIVDSRTWEVEVTTVLDKQSADLESERYTYVYWMQYTSAAYKHGDCAEL
jgi:hypothetical protein